MKLSSPQNNMLQGALPNGITPEINAYINLVADTAAKKAVAELIKENSHAEQVINEEFLSATQAADYLKIKLNSLYSKVEKGELPSYRSGKRKLLFSKKELENFVSASKTKSNDEIEQEVDRYMNGKRRSI